MTTRIKDLGSIITGNTPKTSESANYGSDDICFVKPSDFADGDVTYIKSSEFYISEFARKKSRILPPESVLVTCIGTIGKVAINQVECAFNQQINAIIPNRQRCITTYLAYAIQAKQVTMQEMANAPVVPILNKTQFSDIEINVPPITQQQHIAAVLDKISYLISLRKQQLDKLDELVKARFVEMFGEPKMNPMGWPIVNITTVMDGKVSNGFFAKRDEYVDDGNVAVLGVAYVVNRMYSQCTNLPRTNATEKDIQKYTVKYGDMLFCRSSLVAEGIGKASIVPKDIPQGTLFECHVIRFPLNLSKCVPEFMQVLTTTDFFREQIISQSKTATMTTIGQDGILNSHIILPPMEIQKKYYDFIVQINKCKLTIREGLDKLETMKKTLMQQYFG